MDSPDVNLSSGAYCTRKIVTEEDDRGIKELVFLLGTWHAYAKLRLHTDTTLVMIRDHHGSEKPLRVTGLGCDLATRGKPLPVMRVATGFCSSLKPSTAQPNIHCHFNLANTSPLFFSPQLHQLLPQRSPRQPRTGPRSWHTRHVAMQPRFRVAA